MSIKEGGAGARLSFAASIRDGAGREVCTLFGHSVRVFTPFRYVYKYMAESGRIL